MKLFEQLFPKTAVPALVLGLSPYAFRDLVSGSVGMWIGRSALALVVTSGLVYLTLMILHRLVPRRFANLVYLFDDDLNVAMIDHPFHKRVQPPGSRLGYHEAPHEAVRRVLREELGLNSDHVTFVPDDRGQIGKVTFVPPPVRVQIERRKQRLGVSEHYDFVYLCRIAGVRPKIDSSLNARWMSLAELQTLARTGDDRAPFPDVVPSIERLIPMAMEHAA